MHHEWGDCENYLFEVFWNERSHIITPLIFFVWALTSFKLNVMDRPTVHWLSLVALVLIIFWSLSFDPCPNHSICPSCQIGALIWTQWRQHLSSSPFLCVLVLIIPLLCPCHIVFPYLVSLSWLSFPLLCPSHNYLSVSCCFCPHPSLVLVSLSSSSFLSLSNYQATIEGLTIRSYVLVVLWWL